MPPEIKGFYYDEEKRKYFKITPHHAAPAGAKYTKHAIKVEAKAKKEQQQIEDQQKWLRMWDPIRRCSGLGSSTSSIAGFLLNRNTRLAERPRTAQIWATGAAPSYIDITDARGFLLGPVTSLSCYGHSKLYSLSMSSYSPGHLVQPCLSMHEVYGDSPSEQFLFSPSAMVLTSCVTSDGTVMVAGGGFFGAVPLAHGIDRAQIVIMADETVKHLVFTSSRGHPTEPARFILGARSAVLTHTLDQQYTMFALSSDSRSELLDLSWLGDQLIVSGHRNGNIVLTDSRVRSGPLRSVLRLQARGPVHSIHGISEHHVLAGNLRSSLDMFDLRFSKNLPEFSPHISSPRPSEPVFTFAGYNNVGYQDLPVAVSQNLNAVAAACPDGAIQIYDLWSGKPAGAELRSDHPRSQGHRATSLCFSDYSTDSHRLPTLFAGKTGCVETWRMDYESESETPMSSHHGQG